MWVMIGVFVKYDQAMNVIVYAAAGQSACLKLHEAIEQQVSEERIEICQTVKELARYFRRPLPDQVVFILLIANKEELIEIMQLRDALRERRVIIALPDDHSHTIALAHKLLPRFLTGPGGDFRDVGIVLGNMIKVHCRDQHAAQES